MSEQGQKHYQAVVETVRYTASDAKCPLCRQSRRELVIFSDGALRCFPCPVYERMTRPRQKVAA